MPRDRDFGQLDAWRMDSMIDEVPSFTKTLGIKEIKNVVTELPLWDRVRGEFMLYYIKHNRAVVFKGKSDWILESENVGDGYPKDGSMSALIIIVDLIQRGDQNLVLELSNRRRYLKEHDSPVYVIEKKGNYLPLMGPVKGWREEILKNAGYKIPEEGGIFESGEFVIWVGRQEASRHVKPFDVLKPRDEDPWKAELRRNLAPDIYARYERIGFPADCIDPSEFIQAAHKTKDARRIYQASRNGWGVRLNSPECGCVFRLEMDGTYFEDLCQDTECFGRRLVSRMSETHKSKNIVVGETFKVKESCPECHTHTTLIYHAQVNLISPKSRSIRVKTDQWCGACGNNWFWVESIPIEKVSGNIKYRE